MLIVFKYSIIGDLSCKALFFNSAKLVQSMATERHINDGRAVYGRFNGYVPILQLIKNEPYYPL